MALTFQLRILSKFVEEKLKLQSLTHVSTTTSLLNCRALTLLRRRVCKRKRFKKCSILRKTFFVLKKAPDRIFYELFTFQTCIKRRLQVQRRRPLTTTLEDCGGVHISHDMTCNMHKLHTVHGLKTNIYFFEKCQLQLSKLFRERKYIRTVAWGGLSGINCCLLGRKIFTVWIKLI